MKIIDQTPLQDEAGQISLINRIQGALKYGLSWYANLEAQKTVIAVLSKVLEKGFTLLRNQQLGASEIIVPIILVGSSGIYVLEATPLKGFYRARGDEWGTLTNGVFQPAGINILARTSRLAQVLQVFFDRQGVKLAAPIEPVLIAADPGMHIESVRPNVRIVLSDAIDRFAASLLQGRPVYNAPTVNELVDRIQNPHSARQQAQPESTPTDDAFTIRDQTPFPSAEPSRMQSILNAPKSDALIEKGQPGIEFAFGEEAESTRQPTVMVSNPYPPEADEAPRPAAPAQKRVVGLLPWQIAVLVGIFLCWCVFMAASGTWIYLQQP